MCRGLDCDDGGGGWMCPVLQHSTCPCTHFPQHMRCRARMHMRNRKNAVMRRAQNSRIRLGEASGEKGGCGRGEGRREPGAPDGRRQCCCTRSQSLEQKPTPYTTCGAGLLGRVSACCRTSAWGAVSWSAPLLGVFSARATSESTHHARHGTGRAQALVAAAAHSPYVAAAAAGERRGRRAQPRRRGQLRVAQRAAQQALRPRP